MCIRDSIATPASNIILALLGKDGSFVRQYTLFGAYVVSLDALTYNLGDNGTIVTQPATLAYQYWRVTGGTNSITGFSGLQA